MKSLNLFDSLKHSGLFLEEKKYFYWTEVFLCASTICFFLIIFLWMKIFGPNSTQEDIFLDYHKYELNYSDQGGGFLDGESGDILDFSEFFCGCNIGFLIALRKKYKSFVRTLKKTIFKFLFSKVSWTRFFFNYMIFFNKPLQGMWRFFSIHFDLPLYFSIWEIVFSSLDFYYIIFMISFIGNRREMLKLYQEFSKKSREVNVLVHYHLRKAFNFTVIYVILVLLAQSFSSLNNNLSIFGDDDDSLEIYIFRNIFFLLIMNYRNSRKVTPIINNDRFKKARDTWRKVKKFAQEIVPPQSLIYEVVRLRKENKYKDADEKIKAFFQKHSLDLLKTNFENEIKDIRDQKFKAVVFPMGESYFSYIILFWDILIDQILSVLLSFLYLIWRNNYNIFMAYKIISCIKLSVEMFIETALSRRVLKTSTLYGEDEGYKIPIEMQNV